MLSVKQLSKSFTRASILGISVSFCCCSVIAQAGIRGGEFWFFVVTSVFLIIVSYFINMRHKRIIKELLVLFNEVEHNAVDSTKTRRLLQNDRTIGEMLKSLESFFFFFWYGYFVSGIGLFLIIASFKEHTLSQETELILGFIFLISAMMAIRYLLFVWDIAYLKKTYEEHSHDQHLYQSRKS